MGVQPWFLRQPQRPVNGATADGALGGSESGRVAQSAASTPAEEARQAARVMLPLSDQEADQEADQKTDQKAEQKTAQQTAREVHADAPMPVAQSAPVALPLAFVWMKGAYSMLLFPAVEDPAVLKLYRDVVLYADWLARQRDLQRRQTDSSAEPGALAHPPGAPQQGHFSWPQLQNSTGTPERSLAVWFDKQMSAANARLGWVGATTELMSDLKPWLGSLPVSVADVGDARQAVTDVQAKKALWQILQHQP